MSLDKHRAATGGDRPEDGATLAARPFPAETAQTESNEPPHLEETCCGP